MIARPELLAQASLYCGPGIAVLPLPQDDSWTRDTGPTFLVDGKRRPRRRDWRFNGWGEAYAEYGQDAQMARRVLEHLGVRRFVSRMVLEGGAIAVDGEGTCLVCTPSVLDPKRNPGITKAEAEAELTGFLGVEKVVWLPNGLVDDETGGHVDNVACFARPGVVLALSADDKADANYTRLTENLDVLRAATRRQGPDARGPAGAAAEGAHPPRRATAQPLLHQLLRRQRRRRDAGLPGRGRPGGVQGRLGRVPGAPGGAGRGPGHPGGRRRHPLHHAAGAGPGASGPGVGYGDVRPSWYSPFSSSTHLTRT